MFDIIKPESWSTIRDALPPAKFLVDPIVPAGGRTFLHGSGGVGKSAALWAIGNSVSAGTPWLGLPTSQTRVLLLSNDMTIYDFAKRWADVFVPRFAFLPHDSVDIIHPTFKRSKLWTIVADTIRANHIGLVMIDAAAGLFLGHKATDDDVAVAVYARLIEWFGAEVGVVLLAHDRKRSRDREGNLMDPTDDDFLGSVMWRNRATSQLHMVSTGKHSATITHEKSQVGEKYQLPLKVYIDINGKMELWDEVRATDVIAKWNVAMRELRLGGAATMEQAEQVAKYYNVSQRTALRWRSLANAGREP